MSNASPPEKAGSAEGRAPIPSYFGTVLGQITILTLLLPLAPILPDMGRKTTVMAEVICALAFMFLYKQRRSLYEGELRKGVRGAAGVSMKSIAILALAAAMVVGFFLASDGAAYLKQILPAILVTKFLIPPLQIFTFAGTTFAFAAMAALDYMAKLEEAGHYTRPDYLREDTDLPTLAAKVLRANLQVPEGAEWKIVEREKTRSGGVKLVIAWMQEVTRTTSKGEAVTFMQEKRYKVELDVKGQVISFAEVAT